MTAHGCCPLTSPPPLASRARARARPGPDRISASTRARVPSTGARAGWEGKSLLDLEPLSPLGRELSPLPPMYKTGNRRSFERL